MKDEPASPVAQTPNMPRSSLPRPSARISVTAGVSLALLVAAAVVAVYGSTVDYPLSYDDYHQVRPYTFAEVAASFGGNWDVTAIEKPFYRPLTVAFYALRFDLLGVNERAYRILSLLMLASAGTLLGWAVLALSGRTGTACAAAVLFAVHPAVPYSLASWATNQMHLLAMLLFLTGLLIWVLAPAGRSWPWVALIAVQVLLFLVKEDGIMFAPVLLLLHGTRALSTSGRWAWPPLPALTVLLGLVVVLPLWRYVALGQLGGYGAPSVQQAWTNLLAGPRAVLFQIPAKRPGQLVFAWLFNGIVATGLITAALTRRTSSLLLFAGGATVLVLFDLPFAFAVKAEQLHFIALGATVLFAAGVTALADVSVHRVVGWTALGLGAVACGTAALVAANIAADFAPCAPRTLYTNGIVRGWASVPAEITMGLPSTPATCSPGARRRLTTLPVITFGAYAWEGEGDERFRWSGQRLVYFVSQEKASLTQRMRLRNPSISSTSVSIRIDGRPWRDVAVSEAWQTITIPRPGLRGLFGGQSWTIEAIVYDTWIPARHDARSTDRRTLGIQLGATVDSP